jgi:pyrroloquinoline quinone biosynthesis protein B
LIRIHILAIFLSLALNIYSQSEFIYILGNTQDAGVPHIGCEAEFCQNNYNSEYNFYSTSIAVVDMEINKYILFEATPDITSQLNKISKDLFQSFTLPDKVYLTHAHIGHYAGLMYFGRESLGAKNINVRALTKMADFLKNNGPWDQLVNLNNIEIQQIQFNSPLNSLNNIKVKPIQVPHRDEYSETAGFTINGKNKKALFIPDIDKWEKWNENLEEIIYKYDYLLLDATFYDEKEINRDINEIPHPLVSETMQLLNHLPLNQKNKVYFIHMNHTNMMLDPESNLTKNVIQKGFNIARVGQKLFL